MKKFKNGDLVIITEGEFKGVGVTGKVVDNERSIMSVMLSTTQEVASVHEDHMKKLNLAMKEDDYKEYEKLIKELNVEIKKLSC